MWPLRLTSHRARLALALQGGGAHGAFTWGVLDALLEQRADPIVAISGASAGAMNALLLAHGLLEGGRDGARAALARFWQGLGKALPWEAWGLLSSSGDQLSSAARWMMRWAQAMPPARSNPLRIDPLRDLLAHCVDFERLRGQSQIGLHIAATQANTGRLRVFRNHELTLDAAMASACLPTLHAAVTIDGEAYWDGGFSANPPLMPLLREHSSEDLLVVMLSPLRLGDTPRNVEDIRARSIDIAFNAGFLSEMRMIAQARAMSNRALWHGPFERRLQRTHWHLIDGSEHLAGLPSDSKLISNSPLLERLRDAGRQRMLEWLQAHGAMIGRSSTVDLERVFGGHAVAIG